MESVRVGAFGRPAARAAIVASSLAAAAILLLPNAAFAVDTTIGSAVGTTQCQTDFDVVQMASAVSYTVPAGGGTITSWTTQAPDLAFVGPVNLAVWTLKSPGTYTLVGLSASEPITKIGANMFAANSRPTPPRPQSSGPLRCTDASSISACNSSAATALCASMRSAVSTPMHACCGSTAAPRKSCAS